MFSFCTISAFSICCNQLPNLEASQFWNMFLSWNELILIDTKYLWGLLEKNEMWWNKIQSCLNLKIGTDTSRLLLIVRPFLIMITKLLAGPRRWNPPFCQESLLGHSEVCPKGTISKLLSNFVAKMAGYECFPRNQKIFLSNPNQSYATSVSDV